MNGSSSRSSAWLSWAQQPREQGGLGLAPHQAAGVVGNLVKESGDDLPAWGPTGDNRTAWGTAQWREDRLRALQQMYPDSYQTMESQQAFMRHELDTTHNKAYKALQAARTPEEAATAFNRLYEVSADNTGGREAAARRFMEQFGGSAPSGTGALTSSFAPTESKGSSMPTPALSADEVMGPGALTPSQDKMSVIGQALAGMGSSLAGISNPDQAKVLAAQSASMQKAAVDHGTWSVQTMPDGSSFYFNNKTARRIPIGNFAKPEKDPREEEAAKLEMKRAGDRYDQITTADRNTDEQLSRLDKFEAAVKNPDIYFGPGGDNVVAAKQLASSMGVDVKGLTDAQIVQRMATEAQLARGKMLPGAVSNYEDQLMARANGLGLGVGREANLDAIATQRAILKHQKALAQEAYKYRDKSQYKVLDDGWEPYASDWNSKNGVQIPALPAQAAPAAAPAKASTNTFKTKSGVTWSVH
jgi:hypothetical protein